MLHVLYRINPSCFTRPPKSMHHNVFRFTFVIHYGCTATFPNGMTRCSPRHVPHTLCGKMPTQPSFFSPDCRGTILRGMKNPISGIAPDSFCKPFLHHW